LRRLFTNTLVEQISLLDSLAPEYPATGALARRNHEYPYQDEKGNWRAPSDETPFLVGEMKRARNCAGALMRRLPQILDAFDRLPATPA